MNDYRAEQAEKTAVLRTLSAQVAAELGNGWTVEPEQLDESGRPYFGRPLAYINDGAGSRLMLEPDHRGRLEIRALFEHDRRVNYPEHITITVAVTRPAAAIAREITRRVLPRYAEERVALAERIDKVNGHDTRAHDLAVELAAALGLSKPEQDGSGSYTLRIGVDNLGVHYGDITISGPDYVRCDFTAKPDAARRIAAALAGTTS